MNDDIFLAEQKLNLAKKNYAEGKYLNAVAHCNQALNFVRFSSDADILKEIYFLLGLSHLELGTYYSEWDINDSILACKYFDKVLAIDDKFVAAYLNRGLAIITWGNNYNLALKDFEKVLELDPNNELALKHRKLCDENLQ